MLFKTWVSIIRFAVEEHNENEVAPCTFAFFSLCLVQCSFFMLMPLREEAGIILGVGTLPTLFIAALFATMLMAPLTSNFLSKYGRGLGHRRLFIMLSAALVGFYVTIIVTASFSRIPLTATIVEEAPSTFAYSEKAWRRVQRLVVGCFYVWLNVQHQASISALWVLCADIFDNSAGTRLFGFIGGGSAVGQLLGSMFVVSVVKITAAAQRANPTNPASPGKGLSTGPPTYLILVAAALLLAVAFLSFGLSESGKKLRPDMDIMSKHPIKDPECDKSKIVNIHQESMFKAPAMIVSILSAAKGQISNSMECSLLILRSPYLLAICAYILLQCCTSSQLYFTKAKVVSSQIQHADDRTTYYGLVNVMTATSIFSMQMLATGRIIRRFGLSATLLMSPIIAFFGMLLILICPASTTAWVIAGAEITRKVAGNALTKPAREILFTVVSKKEKYLAKVFIDLVVMRLGDTAAAAMFEAFDVRSGLQFRAFLCMSCFMCLCWAFCALNLGYQHRQMNARKSVKAIL